MTEQRKYTPQNGKRSYPILVLNPGDRYEVSMGVGKVCMALDNLPDLIRFVTEHAPEYQLPDGTVAALRELIGYDAQGREVPSWW